MSKEDDIRLDQKMRAAWIYYIAGQNQSEIASQLGTSRPVVQRLIVVVKEEGIVSISLHHPAANRFDYAQLLQEKYRLIECNVIPAFSEESTLDSVSFGYYQLMARYLQDDREKITGPDSGLTLRKALQRIDFGSLNARCAALISATDADRQCNYYDDVPLPLTRKIKTKYYQWLAPRYAQNVEEYEMWCTNRLFRSASDVTQEADVIFVDVGPLGTRSPIFKDGFINQARMDELTARGDIGEILGRFIDAEGHVVDSEINRMITSYDIRQNHCPHITAACGEYKRPAIPVVLKGGRINGLVTDEHTARWLLTR